MALMKKHKNILRGLHYEYYVGKIFIEWIFKKARPKINNGFK